MFYFVQIGPYCTNELEHHHLNILAITYSWSYKLANYKMYNVSTMNKINYRQASNQSEQLKSNKPCCCRTQQHCCCCWLWASYQQQPSWCRAVLLQSTVSSLQLCATYFSTRQSDNGWHIVNVAFVACRIWKVCWCLQSVCHSPAVVAVTKCMSYVADMLPMFVNVGQCYPV